MGTIQQITVDDLRKMNDKEGLILQGCGGDLQEWLDGINEMFIKERLDICLKCHALLLNFSDL